MGLCRAIAGAHICGAGLQRAFLRSAFAGAPKQAESLHHKHANDENMSRPVRAWPPEIPRRAALVIRRMIRGRMRLGIAQQVEQFVFIHRSVTRRGVAFRVFGEFEKIFRIGEI